MSDAVEYLAGTTFHGRRGAVANRFSYKVDYLIVDPEHAQTAPRLFGRNRAGAISLHDSDHGGPPKSGLGARWLRTALEQRGLGDIGGGRIELITQPRVLGHVFNPVSFWLVHDRAGALRIVVPEVSNTFGDRHSYLCHRDDLAPITRDDRLEARKVFHVSPFQPVEGLYRFRFDIRAERVEIAIDYERADGGLLATLGGPRRPLRTRDILRAALRRPFGSRRVLGLIHWQALKLWWRGARFRPRPAPPVSPISR
ncbi:DUF1365 domain-containing protein [Profundibacterium mesophilum]|uniref:Cyclopropanecyclopropene fatty acid synthesis protein n=1 Tax=Profundibacterium mesophilum KAUST100406-0324 TaxID=1037889 RepID=A0A921NW58_9RHOB|nr:DUF1365 domain-containing protein [Profundibacterium mesophilum]KAF0676585.1 putative cyclopropanecyclopropene fatty acid synthesis protein [Profundibacterium mesophilum KAUST100406-0324]